MVTTIQAALQQSELYTDNVEYALIRLPTQAVTAAAGIVAEVGEPFAALLVDKDEITIVIPTELVTEFSGRIPEDAIADTRYRLITFDVELAPTLIGFMAKVSEALAAAGVSILPYAAFSRDHLLVPTEQIDLALKTLENLKDSL